MPYGQTCHDSSTVEVPGHLSQYFEVDVTDTCCDGPSLVLSTWYTRESLGNDWNYRKYVNYNETCTRECFMGMLPLRPVTLLTHWSPREYSCHFNSLPPGRCAKIFTKCISLIIFAIMYRAVYLILSLDGRLQVNIGSGNGLVRQTTRHYLSHFFTNIYVATLWCSYGVFN